MYDDLINKYFKPLWVRLLVGFGLIGLGILTWINPLGSVGDRVIVWYGLSFFLGGLGVFVLALPMTFLWEHDAEDPAERAARIAAMAEAKRRAREAESSR